MRQVGLNKAEVDALTRLDKEVLLDSAMRKENRALIAWLKREYIDSPPSDKQWLDIINTSNPYYSIHRPSGRNRRGSDTSILNEAINLAKDKTFRFINNENSIIVKRCEDPCLFQISMETTNVNLNSKKRHALMRYLRILNAKAIRNKVPAIFTFIKNVEVKKSDDVKIVSDNTHVIDIFLDVRLIEVMSQEHPHLTVNPYSLLSNVSGHEVITVAAEMLGTSISSLSFLNTEIGRLSIGGPVSASIVRVREFEQILKTLQRFSEA